MVTGAPPRSLSDKTSSSEIAFPEGSGQTRRYLLEEFVEGRHVACLHACWGIDGEPHYIESLTLNVLLTFLFIHLSARVSRGQRMNLAFTGPAVEGCSHVTKVFSWTRPLCPLERVFPSQGMRQIWSSQILVFEHKIIPKVLLTDLMLGMTFLHRQVELLWRFWGCSANTADKHSTPGCPRFSVHFTLIQPASKC